MTMPQTETEYDVIFAGGGTAACVAAGRLAQANPELSILLIEQGPNNLNDPTVTTPALFMSHLLPDSKTTLFYQAKASDALNGRAPVVPSGGVLGGGSSINFMMYTRAQAIDYDSWKVDGWDTQSLMPYIKRLESYHYTNTASTPGVEGTHHHNGDTHGHEGPINVSAGPFSTKGPQDDLLAAAESLGYPEIPDLQNFESVNGFSRWRRYVGPDGTRQDAAHRFIHPLMASGEHPNLHLLVETKVSRVVFDEQGCACGVECWPRAGTTTTTSTTINAKRLVVVSAGALGTPSILERSGVGSGALLQKLGIPVVSDLPGVGENYQDHHLMLYPYKSTLKADETLDGLFRGDTAAPASGERNPMLGWNAIDVASKLRPTAAEAASLGPDFEAAWDRDFQPNPTKPLMFIAMVQTFLGNPAALKEQDGKQFFTLGTFSAYPYSRGSIHITSPDLNDAASIDTGFLSHPADLAMHVWAYKKQRELGRRTNAYAGDLPFAHPNFPPGSEATTKEERGGKFNTVEDRRSVAPIKYTEEDDAAIQDWIRSNVATTWHSLGTCKMAPREAGGVVDKELNVYGTKQLKCVDLSIVPENVGANTNHTALLIGEKAADIIAKELGLRITPAT